MPRNLEIKARIDSVDEWLAKVGAPADSGPSYIAQDDTFFNCPSGRLKLRVFSSGQGELILYRSEQVQAAQFEFHALAFEVLRVTDKQVERAAFGIGAGHGLKIETLYG